VGQGCRTFGQLANLGIDNVAEVILCRAQQSFGRTIDPLDVLVDDAAETGVVEVCTNAAFLLDPLDLLHHSISVLLRCSFVREDPFIDRLQAAENGRSVSSTDRGPSTFGQHRPDFATRGIGCVTAGAFDQTCKACGDAAAQEFTASAKK
jgi:hypothetical protein